MVRALRVVSVEQGLDPRDFVLVAFGGAGPLHACALADELEMETVLVPRSGGSPLGARARGRRRAPGRGALVRRAARRSRRAAVGRRGGSALRGSVVRAHGSAGRRPRRAVPRGARGALRLRGSRARARARGRPNRRDPTGASDRSHRSRACGPRASRCSSSTGATAWVPDGWAGETDPHGTLVLRRTA